MQTSCFNYTEMDEKAGLPEGNLNMKLLDRNNHKSDLLQEITNMLKQN
jgi:hypothetical protein